jgi:transcriptional regulator GlxA family with amidase domain
VNLLDDPGPCEVFSSLAEAIGDLGATAYTIEVVSTVRGQTVESSGGGGVWEAARDRELPDWLRDAAPKARRVGSISTGAFLLAATGLLDGRKATTHWRWCDRLAREYPAIAVSPDPIVLRDGHV